MSPKGLACPTLFATHRCTIFTAYTCAGPPAKGIRQSQTASQESDTSLTWWVFRKRAKIQDRLILWNQANWIQMEKHGGYAHHPYQSDHCHAQQGTAEQRTSNWKGQASPITSTPLYAGRLHLISGESSSEFSQPCRQVLTNAHILQAKSKEVMPQYLSNYWSWKIPFHPFITPELNNWPRDSWGVTQLSKQHVTLAEMTCPTTFSLSPAAQEAEDLPDVLCHACQHHFGASSSWRDLYQHS